MDDSVTVDEVAEAARAGVSDREGEEAMTIAEKLQKQGEKIGEKIGVKKGRTALLQRPAERLTAAVRDRNAFTLEAWITPAPAIQTGPARIVTLSRDHGNRNFTLGQEERGYQMRLRTTATSANGLPALQVGGSAEASIAALRSLNRDRAAIFVTHGGLLKVDRAWRQHGLEAHWFDPFTGERCKAAPRPDGSFQPPSRGIWLLVLRRQD